MAYPFGQPVFQAGGGQYYPLPQPVYQNYPPAPNTDYPEEPGQFPMERQPGVFHGHELPLGCMVPALLHNNNDGIFISQKFDLLEAVTGWQVPTIHRVYEGSNDPKNRPSRQIFTCREYSDICARQCMSAACKPFEMRVVNNLSTLQEVVFSMHREFTCTFFCHNRPEKIGR